MHGQLLRTGTGVDCSVVISTVVGASVGQPLLQGEQGIHIHQIVQGMHGLH